MKTLLAGSLLALSVLVASAFDLPERGYVSGELGLFLPQEVNIKEVLGFPAARGHIDLETGVRLGLEAGCRVNDEISVELETGLLLSSVKSGSGISGDFYGVPVLGNLIYRVPLLEPFKPYVGAGLGGFYGRTSATSGLGRGDADAYVFAYQVIAGLAYDINDRLSVHVAYKFLGTSDFDFKGAKTDGLITHSLLGGVSYRF